MKDHAPSLSLQVLLMAMPPLMSKELPQEPSSMGKPLKVTYRPGIRRLLVLLPPLLPLLLSPIITVAKPLEEPEYPLSSTCLRASGPPNMASYIWILRKSLIDS